VPDGYEFRGDRGGAGLIVEFFGGNQRETYMNVAKGGAITRIWLLVPIILPAKSDFLGGLWSNRETCRLRKQD
jgi:hypothetical protein